MGATARTGWVGDGDGWLITATVCTPYCVCVCVLGADQETAKGVVSQGAHLHPILIWPR
jgi:hypothetical protein